MQTPSVASIPNALVAVTFLQVWETESASCQEGWLDTMRVNIDLLRTKPGFVSMLLHRSLDPRNLCVYAQWLDKEHLESAVTDAKVQGAREKLDRWAQPDGTLYSFHSLVAPPNSAETALEIAADSALAFVNVWECGDPHWQRHLLEAMEEEASAIARDDGFLGIALHASFDGKRVGAYGRWKSLEAFKKAVQNNSEALWGLERLSKWGTPKANLFRVEGVYLPLP